MNRILKKTITGILVAALSLSALPLEVVFAQGENPPQPSQFSNERLERAWARQLRLYQRLRGAIEHSDARIERFQGLIDRAASNGRDVSALQKALEAYEYSLKEVHPSLESLKGIVNSHQGFDTNGNVTDPEKARATLEAMRGILEQVKSALNQSFRALREAFRDFRESNSSAIQRPDTRGT